MIQEVDVFFSDFGVDVVGPNNVKFRGIFNIPDQIVGDDMRVVTTEYELTYKFSALSLKYGDELRINGATYSVREVLKQSDGVFALALLSKE